MQGTHTPPNASSPNIFLSFSPQTRFIFYGHCHLPHLTENTRSTMSHESVWYSRPRTYGKGSRNCVVTGEKKKAGIIRKYGLNMSRQAFREKAADIGFVKYR
ncbi:hypothetical protein LEMA_P100110.1 [Plenodomus lingam JN3]|uniref:40S ribosomal protein S29 n=1 Tax=Leptosphaeria maculans (strain JN3 / isolate v23.1.3 / race Av1-4-5-6-7-8) TaxID=985895 RepID=E5A020_LEPMJ|nr:hypothetical protein LEMA_P100110.1 [Plenodomus lingam JN3]CBX96880.1 hypothetical protein LEMA_P100110.1 [Plenodomus lingam JN3]